MLGRRKWFDAGSKGMVLCWKEGDGSMLGSRIGSFVGFQTGNWMPKTNLKGKKKTNLAGEIIWQEQRIGAPTKTNLAGTKNWHPDKNYFGRNTYYEYNNN